jgi:hypothetical protein
MKAYHNKKMTIVLIFIAAILIAIGLYWYRENIWKQEIHWKLGPEVTFTPADLAQVQWIDEPEEHLNLPATKKVIALAFGKNSNELLLHGTREVLTDPQWIYRIIDGLLKSKRIADYRDCGMFYMKIVFEDKTGMKIWVSPDFNKNIIRGVHWESEELYPILEEVICPFNPYLTPSSRPSKE